MVKKNPRIRDLHKILDLDQVAADAALAGLDKVFRAQSKRLFSSEGSSGGNAWPALSSGYGAWKKKRYPSRKILHGPDRPGAPGGSLKRSISTRASGQHVAEVSRRGKKWAIAVGTDNPYAQYHLLGTPSMPQRDPMQATDRQLQARIKAIHNALIPHVIRKLRVIQAAGQSL